MHDPVIKPQLVKAVVCPYVWTNTPARNGTSKRTKGASFQYIIAACVCISERFCAVPYASTGIWGADLCVVLNERCKNKTTHSILKGTRLMANKIKQVVSGKELWIRGKKISSSVCGKQRA